MSLAGAIVTFILVWWLFFFMVLPIGVTPDEHPQAGTVESAPARPRLLLKAGITTVLAALATWGIAWFLDSGWVGLRPHGLGQAASLTVTYPAAVIRAFVPTPDTHS